MRYLSVCSGIEAATVAWETLGWEPVAFAESDPFPSAVLAHHYPDTPNLGDITKIHEPPPAKVIVGGTPCQSFSVAGLRQGMADPRGRLVLDYLRLAGKCGARWVVWENVPGVLPSNGGRDFGSLVGALGKLGYGWAYRILDAQYFGLAQRRKRVFLVGYLGDWRPPAAVLFEPESLRGDSPPRREAGQAAPTIPARRSAGGGLGTDFDCDGGLVPDQSMALNAKGGAGRMDAESETFVPMRPSHWDGDHPRPTLGQSSRGSGGIGASNQEVFSQRGGGLVPTAFAQNSRDEVRFIGGDGGIAGALPAQPGMKQQTYVSFRARHKGQHGCAVRRLTPRECERLQGFPDDYTRIPWRGKDAEDCPDGPRYKALGNSMAVPVMRWIGQRIARYEVKAGVEDADDE